MTVKRAQGWFVSGNCHLLNFANLQRLLGMLKAVVFVYEKGDFVLFPVCCSDYRACSTRPCLFFCLFFVFVFVSVCVRSQS